VSFVKIPPPAKPEAPPFKRKRGPPPQATKLLVASLGAGLVFMALLAIVFVPRYLENLNPPPSTLLTLQLNTTASTPRIVVTSALYDLALSKFNATLSLGNVTIGSLGAGLTGGSGALTFVDANHDGNLDAGDFFAFTPSGQGSYHFEVWQIDVGHRVGVLSWTGSPG
jgi:hypothetical protein